MWLYTVCPSLISLRSSQVYPELCTRRVLVMEEIYPAVPLTRALEDQAAALCRQQGFRGTLEEFVAAEQARADDEARAAAARGQVGVLRARGQVGALRAWGQVGALRGTCVGVRAGAGVEVTQGVYVRAHGRGCLRQTVTTAPSRAVAAVGRIPGTALEAFFLSLF